MFALAEKQASYGDTEVNQSQRDSNTSLQHDAVELSWFSQVSLAAAEFSNYLRTAAGINNEPFELFLQELRQLF